MKNDYEEIINDVSKIAWKKLPYKKQNWGKWFHSISSYVGRIKPAFAHWLIKTCSEKSDVILDPFCGIGTVNLESDFLGRKSYGVDLNPYATLIAKSKMDRRGLNEELNYLKTVNLDTSMVDLSDISAYFKEYYHPQTLKEIISLRNSFIKDERYFLFGCLLGISHGHRPQHLSIRTGYIIPYIPNPKPKVEYKPAVPRMIQKVKRMYSDHPSLKSYGQIFEADTREMPLENNSIDVIISSPPYYNTLDYIQTNHLRLELMGIKQQKQQELKGNLIQDKKTYLIEMDKTADEIKRVMNSNGLIVFVLGDVHFPKYSINTAEDISSLYSKKGFQTHAIIPDEIPAEKTTIVKYNGQNGIKSKKQKMDRILIMSLENK